MFGDGARSDLISLYARPEPASRVLLLFSGGFDSTLVACHLNHLGVELHTLELEYESRPKAESDAADTIAKLLNFQTRTHLRLPVDDVRSIRPDLHGSQHEAWFPYRNLIILALAARVAWEKQCRRIAAGFRYWDDQFSDTSVQYLGAVQSLLGISGLTSEDCAVDLYAPLHESEKAVIELATSTPDFAMVSSLSSSCWRAEAVSCGQCDPCKGRLEFERLLSTDRSL